MDSCDCNFKEDDDDDDDLVIAFCAAETRDSDENDKKGFLPLPVVM